VSASAPTTSRRLPPAEQSCEAGLSLVEVLFAVLVLGILAAVAVLAVRHTSGSAEDAACAADRRSVDSAVAAYRERTSAPLNEEALVTAGYLDGPSARFDVSSDGHVVATSGRGCTGDESAVGGSASMAAGPGAPATTGAPEPVDALTGTSTAAGNVPPTGGVGGAVPPPVDAGTAAATTPPPAVSGTLPFATVPAGPFPTLGNAAPIVTSGGEPTASTTAAGKAPTDVALVPTGPPATILTALDRHSIVLTLTWTGNADLDLWVEDPQGHIVGWAAPTAPDGGFLDIDEVPPRPDSLGPHVERVTWPAVTSGAYVAWVRFASGGWGPQGAGTGYTLAVRADDELLGSAGGAIGHQGEQSPVVRAVLGAS
jgi:type II secretory pathway pseudopilin PulG